MSDEKDVQNIDVLVGQLRSISEMLSKTPDDISFNEKFSSIQIKEVLDFILRPDGDVAMRLSGLLTVCTLICALEPDQLNLLVIQSIQGGPMVKMVLEMYKNGKERG